MAALEQVAALADDLTRWLVVPSARPLRPRPLHPHVSDAGPALFFSPRSQKRLGPRASPGVTGHKAARLDPTGPAPHFHRGYIQSGVHSLLLGSRG